MRAFLVVNCQSALVWLALRSCSQAAISSFLNVAAYAYKEWQHDGFASTFPFQPIPNLSGNVNFDPTWAVEINYSQPLGFCR
jgi:hypothetical protein